MARTVKKEEKAIPGANETADEPSQKQQAAANNAHNREEYLKRFKAMHIRKALLQLAIENPQVILEQKSAIIDTVVSLSKDYAQSLFDLRLARKAYEDSHE